jgi:uncharacterized protein YndB with AHSA1/START domain
MSNDPVVVEVTVAVPADVVWHALRNRAQLRRWFGWDYDGLGEEIDMIFFSDSATESEQERWMDTGGGGRFDLEERERETVVRVTRAAPDGGTWDGVYDDINEGWLAFVQQLRFLLERHPDEDRRSFSTTHPDPHATLELVGGEDWFRSTHQHAVTLDGGAGLLIAMRDRVILSTYGLDAARFDALRAELTP